MLQFLNGIQVELTLFFVGSTFIMMVFAIWQWLQIHDRSLLIYALACAFMQAYFIRNAGIMPPLSELLAMPEEALWRYTETTLGLGMCFSYVLFIYHFLKYPAHFSKKALWPIWGTFGIFSIILLLDLYFLFVEGALDKSANLQWYAQAFIVFPQYYMIILGFRLKDIVSRIVISGYFLSLVVLPLLTLWMALENPGVEFFPARDPTSVAYRSTIVATQFSLFLESLFFLYAFVYRIRIFQNERDKAYRELWLKQQEARHLREMEAQKGRFFTNISHEFRTPLTAILGSAEQVVGNGKHKQRIERNARQLLRMVNQILELAKLQDGKLQPKWVQADVVAFLKYLADPFRSMAIAQKQAFVFHTEMPRLLMDYDPDMLQSIFSNLVGNALKFTPEYGEVKVIARREEKTLLLTVADNGPGMPPKVSARIFDRFYSASSHIHGHDNSSPLPRPPKSYEGGGGWEGAGTGAGIGLSLVRELTALLGGEVSVDSHPGAGTTFTVRLPIHRNAPVTELSRPDWMPAEAIPQPGLFTENGKQPASGARPTILIVEDNPDIIAYLREMLEERYAIRHARHGKEALDMLREHPIALILCDLMMPEMDGLELCRIIREKQQYRHLPVIMITAKATHSDKMRGLAAGADAYLEKPFKRQELLLRIDRLLQAQGRARANEKDSTFLKELDAAIEANLDNEIFNVNHLCRALHLARPTLNKRVKAATGLPPGEYLRRRRLAHARHLLETTDMPISEVAQEVGFKTAAHFSSAFKEAYGVTPSQARK